MPNKCFQYLIRLRAISLFTLLLGLIPDFTAAESKDLSADIKSEIGRYQLFQGSYVALDSKNNRAESEQAVFLIDTSNGNIFKYSTGLDSNGKLFEYWEPTAGLNER